MQLHCDRARRGEGNAGGDQVREERERFDRLRDVRRSRYRDTAAWHHGAGLPDGLVAGCLLSAARGPGLRRRQVRQPGRRAVHALLLRAEAEPVAGAARRDQAGLHHHGHAGRRARGNGRGRLGERARDGRLHGRRARPGPRGVSPSAGPLGDQRYERPRRCQPAQADELHQIRDLPEVHAAQGRRHEGEPDRGPRGGLPGHRVSRLPLPRAVGPRGRRDLPRSQPPRPYLHAAPASSGPRPEDPSDLADHCPHPRHLRRRRPAHQAERRPGHRGPHPGREVRLIQGNGPQPSRGTLAADHRRNLRDNREVPRLIPDGRAAA
jgi:hypothetical protein